MAGKRRLRPPPDVTLHPDRGMPFGRFSKTTHDQRVFKPLNQGTRLPVMDPAIDPYNLGTRGGVYDPQTGQIRGSLVDTATDLRRAQEGIRRAEQAEAAARRSIVPPIVPARRVAPIVPHAKPSSRVAPPSTSAKLDAY
ncbi:MAG TPA: hypothetical protein VFD92_27340 [Candidatus Binatia bacterium]|nr:hypothetical protein [Candidatus Binatia bacterium]